MSGTTSMCKICLRQNVPLQSVFDSKQQELYEALTLLLFEADDIPMRFCPVCCAKLDKCYRLMKRCLQNELILKWMYNSDASAPADTKKVPQLLPLRKITPGREGFEQTIQTKKWKMKK